MLREVVAVHRDIEGTSNARAGFDRFKNPTNALRKYNATRGYAEAILACGEFLQSVGSRLDAPGRANGGAQSCRGRSVGAVCKHPLYRRSNLTC